MIKVVEMKFGSELYGTKLPSSDTDYKGVFIPNSRDLILQRAPKQIILNTKKDTSIRNTAEDIDREFYSLHKFVDLLMEGQTVALDMIFCTDSVIEVHSDTWYELKRNVHKLLSSNSTSFIGYCNTQAAKYGIKGSRISSLAGIINLLKTKDENVKLATFWNEVEEYTKVDEHSSIVLLNGHNEEPIPHLDVCDKKVAIMNTVKQALPVYERALSKYGNRAKEAQDNENIDWKALHHAVRVCSEAEELLSTGRITFPRPDRELLLKIKKGEMPYTEVAEIIEAGMDRVKELEKNSVLRDKPDREWAENFVYDTYKRHINV